jgi:hypothetical protein
LPAKYRGQAGAVEASVKRVREGSTKIWGEIPMLPHPQHTTDEVTIMLRWVFALEKGKGGPALVRGLSSEVTAPKADQPGAFLLEATYTDAGRAPAGSLSGKASVSLRARRIEAESGEIKGPRTLGFGSASGKHGLGAIDHGTLQKSRTSISATCARSPRGPVPETSVENRVSRRLANGRLARFRGSSEYRRLGELDRTENRPAIQRPAHTQRCLCGLRQSGKRWADESRLGAVRPL